MDNHEFDDGGDSIDWIGVHVMAEVSFCRRAGVLAYEGSSTDSGEEDSDVPSLGYLPSYDLALIEEKLNQKWDKVLKGLVVGIPLAIMILFVGLLFGWLYSIPMLAGCGVLAYWWGLQLRDVLELARRRREAMAATPAEPDLAVRAMQPVNWWSLIKAGFQPVTYEEPFREGYLKLKGKPWRVLQRDSQRIPVFRKRSGDIKIHKQHVLRIAAYAHLLRQCEGADVPFGVVLFGNQNEGVAVPTTANDTVRLEIALNRARQTTELLIESVVEMPPTPEMTQVCHGCPFGLPRRYRRGKSETKLRGVTVVPFITEGDDGKPYHSTCGDRFRWVPPHERAQAKRLC